MSENDHAKLFDLFAQTGSRYITENDQREELVGDEITKRIGKSQASRTGTAARARPGNVGIPMGFDPQSVDHMVLVIDPTMPTRHEISVGELRDLSRQKKNGAGLHVSRPSVVDVPRPVRVAPSAQPAPVAVGAPVVIRAEAAAAAPPSVKLAEARNAPAFPDGSSMPGSQAPGVSLQRLRRPPAATLTDSVRAEIAAPAAVVPDPTMEVLFEVADVGTFGAFYHTVLVRDRYVVLIYDAAWKGSKFIPHTDKELLMRVGDAAPTMVLLTTGVSFTHAGYEYCLLLRSE